MSCDHYVVVVDGYDATSALNSAYGFALTIIFGRVQLGSHLIELDAGRKSVLTGPTGHALRDGVQWLILKD